MSSRRLAILVGIAVVAGIGIAAYGFATRGSSKPAHRLQIDEVNGRVGRIVLGESRENVIAVLGRPKPQPVPHSGLAYPHLFVGFRADHVVLVETDDPTAQTEKVVSIGDPLSAARASYRKAAKCNPNSPDKTAKHPHCTVTVPAGALEITGDPIGAMTLTAKG